MKSHFFTRKNTVISTFLVLVILLSSCYRSQFSTTSRHEGNGKVRYVNHYSTKNNRLSKGKSRESMIKEKNVQDRFPSSAITGMQNLPVPEVMEFNPVSTSNTENLIASTSKVPTIIAGNVYSDTNKRNKPIKGTPKIPSSCYQIKFKNGHEETVIILGRSGDTLKYQVISESGVVRTVLMQNVDIILLLKVDSIAAAHVDNRKTEPLGLAGFILSFPGLFPGLGLPFSILAIIWGFSSLRKTKRNPEKYKKGYGFAAIIIGFTGIALLAAILIASAIGGGGPGGVL